MKEITAIIRMNKIQPTKKALFELGFPSFTAQKVLGRGYQKGLQHEFSPALPDEKSPDINVKSHNFIAKRMITILVDDESADEVVRTIIKTNQTGNYGDGKIFIQTVKEIVRIRTNEKGVRALF